jgi:hypothetical protein
MKRSERFAMRARHCAMMTLGTFVGTGCVGIWSVVEMMGDGSHAGGLALPLFVLSITGLFFAGSIARECAHNLRMFRKESRWEHDRAIRPKI